MSKQKEKFFAQYWGQKVMCSEVERNPFEINENNLHRWIPECYLELTPLSQISDADGKMCVQVRSSTHIDVEITSRSNDGFGFTSRYNTSNRRRLHGYSLGFGEKMTIEQIDYLRSKGYALPWLGISVEEQISKGWVKLSTRNRRTAGSN